MKVPWEKSKQLNPWKHLSKVNPQPKSAPYRHMTRDILQAIMKTRFSSSEHSVLWCIIDLTWGFNSLYATFSYAYVAKSTGLDRRLIKRAMVSLKKRRVIYYEQVESDLNHSKFHKGQDQNTYLFNKHYDTWINLKSDQKYSSDDDLKGGEKDPFKKHLEGGEKDPLVGDPNAPFKPDHTILIKNKVLKESTTRILSTTTPKNESLHSQQNDIGEREKKLEEIKQFFSYLQSSFEKFIEQYPSHRRNKSYARRAWYAVFGGNRHKSKDFYKKLDVSVFEQLIASLNSHKKSDKWKKDNGNWIPSADKWLRNHNFICKVELNSVSCADAAFDEVLKALRKGKAQMSNFDEKTKAGIKNVGGLRIIGQTNENKVNSLRPKFREGYDGHRQD